MYLFERLDNILSKIEELILSSGVIIMAAVLVGNVISRRVLNDSWGFAEELGQMLVIAITFIGASYAARKGRHIRMSAIFDAVSPKLQKIVYIIISITTSTVMLVLSYLAYNYMLTVQKIDRVTPVLRMPVSIVVAVVAVGFFLTAVQYLSILFLNLKYPELYIGTDKITNVE